MSKIHTVLDIENRIWKSDNCKLLRTRSSLYFESLVSNKNYSGKLVTDNWFKINHHLPMCGINVTSECKRNMRNTISVDSLFRQEYFYSPLSSVLFLVRWVYIICTSNAGLSWLWKKTSWVKAYITTETHQLDSQK